MKKEMLCYGTVYEMRLNEKSQEEHIPAMSISGKDLTGEPCMRAHRGEFPHWDYKVPFYEAKKFIEAWIGSCLRTWLSHGENLTVAYSKDMSRKYEKVEKGEVFYTIAIDINYKKNNHYIRDGVKRYKIEYVKV